MNDENNNSFLFLDNRWTHCIISKSSCSSNFFSFSYILKLIIFMNTKFLSNINGILFIVILATLFPSKSISQSSDYYFDGISGNSGVSIGKINFITQDNKGFMWFSDQNNGSLIRYDGSHMKEYKRDVNKLNSLGGEYPECLFADANGNIWIGFYGQGLDKFNTLTGEFKHYRHDPEDPQSLSNDFVSSVLIDGLGTIWVGTNGGLDRLDPVTGNFTHYKNKKNDSTSLSHDVVRTIYEDREGTIWVGTGLAWANNDRGGLNRFDRQKNSFKKILASA